MENLSLAKLKFFPAFLRMKLTSDIYSGFSKIFRATVSRGRFCVIMSQEITVYWCDWFYFTVEELNIDDIGNFQDSPRLVFTDEECGNLKVVNDGGELTRNIKQNKKSIALQ